MPLGVDDKFNLYFYKYRNFANGSMQYLERLFLHQELYFAAPGTFNDPFECRPLFNLDGLQSERAAHYKQTFQKFGQGMTRKDRRLHTRQAVKAAMRASDKQLQELRDGAIEVFTKKLGVFCLTKEPDNILMWSHYAANHTGICLEFHGHVDAPFFIHAQEVQYQTEYPNVNLLKMSRDEKMILSVLTKAQAWAYEKEWRIIETRGGPCVYRYPEGQLSAVIFGDRTSDEHKALVRGWIKKMPHPPALYQSRLKKTEYGLEIVSA